MQQFERLAAKEMHARRGKFQTVVAPVEDQFLRHHRKREAGEKRD